MKHKKKIAIVSHALVNPVNQNRWKILAQDDNYEVHLLVPKYWKTNWFAEEVIYEPKEVHEGNFNVWPIPTTNPRHWGTYFFKSMDANLRKIKPDFIFIVHEESVRIHHQIFLYKSIFASKAKIFFFSMNARGIPYQSATNPLKKIIHKILWLNIKKNTEVALVHYPGCLKSLRSGGYQKPIYLQTQIGVDENLFAPCSDTRSAYRKKLGFYNKFVIGYTGRLTNDKGVDDIAAVFLELAKENQDIALLFIGNGELKNDLLDLFKQNNLEDRTHITGFIDQDLVPKYMNAMDTFILGSKTTKNWIDTFPLVTVQAQAVGLPVIASDSASIPWQLADTAKIYPEGDLKKLKNALIQFISNPELREDYSKKGKQRSHDYFCHKGMTKNFKKILNQIENDQYIYHKDHEYYTQWKAY
ncbi:MAG: glycosyltransferase family 4 protein [Rhodomicrobiaceae bacterium]